MSLPDLVAALLRPEIYPHRPADIRLEQTHISCVFLADDQVYKIKKPVRFSFLDFSTLPQRRHFCHEEVRLNRRLAAGMYFGVVAICRQGESYRLGPEDDPEAVEYAVHMRRLPEDRLLDRLLVRNQVTPDMIDALAARLAAFHRTAATGPAITRNGDPAAVWDVLNDNYSNAWRFRGLTIPAADDDAIQGFSRKFLQSHEALFRERQAQHRIRECHGDLHTEHICFTSEVVIFDCIEFNPRFRYCDVASELAFLAMDLDYHERHDLAADFVTRYVEHSGDAGILHLLPFYQCYRAYVRGKVDSLRGVEEEVAADEREAARQSASRHFALAYRYTWAYSRCIVAFAGLSGTGKSTVAATLHQRTGFPHFSSDVLRKQLAETGTPQQLDSGLRGYETGLYAPEHTARTYEALLAAAAQQLEDGHAVILDATFQRRSDRQAVAALARARRVTCVFVECRCSEEEARLRLEHRARRRDSVSDADWAIYVEQRRRFDPFLPDEIGNRILVDTSLPVEETCAAVERELRALGCDDAS